jgi:hypothetical protein
VMTSHGLMISEVSNSPVGGVKSQTMPFSEALVEFQASR